MTGLIDRDAVGIVWMARARATAMNTARLTFEMIGEPSGFRARQTAARMKEESTTFVLRMAEAERNLPGFAKELKIARDSFDRLTQRIEPLTAAKLAQADGLPGEAMRDLVRPVIASVDEFDGLMNKLIDQAQEQARAQAKAAAAHSHASSDMIVTMVAVSLGVIFVFAFLLLRLTVVRPLHRLIATAKEILGGTLDRKVEGVERRDEVGDIARVIQLLKDTLVASDTLARRTQSAAEQVAATSQAAAAVEQVSGGSQRQMQSVEAITGSVSRTTAIIGTIASVSLSAKDRSRAAATQLASGLTQMTAMTAAVREIAVTSARINSITQSIGELATRSNILSLNAAIEAARAGEHGRGFSVVAEEVGNLAQQTANLAQEIAFSPPTAASASRTASASRPRSAG